MVMAPLVASFAFVLLAASAGATNPGICVVTHCAKELFECEIDSVCRTWSSCTQKCSVSDTACQIRCGDLYKPTDDTAKHINAFSECLISDNHCVAQQNMTCPVPDYPKGSVDIADFTGTWYITRGLNPLYDCFDCQVHSFRLDDGAAKPLVGDLSYSVKVDMNCTEGSCHYLERQVHQSFAQDPSDDYHLLNHNNTVEEMHYADDWYVVAAKKIPITSCSIAAATTQFAVTPGRSSTRGRRASRRSQARTKKRSGRPL